MAWPPGSPEATTLTVVPFRDGAPAGDGVAFRGPFTGGEPHAALSVDAQDRLWAVWTRAGAVHVARSRSHGQHFGAVVSAALPGAGTAYQVSAAALPGEPETVDVIVNLGSALVEQQLKPGLSVQLSKKTKLVGTKKVVTRWAQALDDGFGVPTATFRIGGRMIHADAQGKARVTTGSGKAAAPGYAGASFHVR